MIYNYSSLLNNLLRFKEYKSTAVITNNACQYYTQAINGISLQNISWRLASTTYYILLVYSVFYSQGAFRISSWPRSQLDTAVHSLSTQGIAKSTARSYKSGVYRYINFCGMFGFQPFPLSEQILCRFVAYLCQSRLSPSTIHCISNISPEAAQIPWFHHFHTFTMSSEVCGSQNLVMYVPRDSLSHQEFSEFCTPYGHNHQTSTPAHCGQPDAWDFSLFCVHGMPTCLLCYLLPTSRLITEIILPALLCLSGRARQTYLESECKSALGLPMMWQLCWRTWLYTLPPQARCSSCRMDHHYLEII